MQVHIIQNMQQLRQLIVFHVNTVTTVQIQFRQKFHVQQVKHVEKAYQVFLVQLID